MTDSHCLGNIRTPIARQPLLMSLITVFRAVCRVSKSLSPVLLVLQMGHNWVGSCLVNMVDAVKFPNSILP